MQHRNPSPASSKKNVLSNYVYQTNHNFRKNFKSESLIETTFPEDDINKVSSIYSRNICTQTSCSSEINIDETKSNPHASSDDGPLVNTCTQTSRTVIYLGISEIESARLSPDSLSPRKDSKDDFTLSKNSSKVHEIDILPFQRKGTVVNYLQSCHELESPKNDFLTGFSLTRAFLEKSKCKRKGLPYGKQRQIPVEKVIERNYLKSQSYIEQPTQICAEITETPERPPAATRFKVTNVTEKHAEDKIKPLRFFCQPFIKGTNQTSTCGDIPSATGNKRSNSFMAPTIASEIKDKSIEIKSIKNLISPTRRGRSASPRSIKQKSRTSSTKSRNKSIKVPYIDISASSVHKNHPVDCKESPKKNTTVSLVDFDKKSSSEGITCNSFTCLDTATSATSTESTIQQAVFRLRSTEWNTALRGLAEIVEICRVTDADTAYPYMTTINQRIIELLKSPRSHVCRTACQAIGHIFEFIKDTRRPEFDEIVDTLLCKTADSNKFIRHDANLALDCMVTHISTFHAIRAICAKALDHKNVLVRAAAARLIVCCVVITGPQTILHPQNNDYTRRRIILGMVKLMDDKNVDIRKFGDRLYKLLNKDRIFEVYLKRFLEKDVIVRIRRCLKGTNGQRCNILT